MAKTTLTDAISTEICTLLEKGNYLETAAQVAGVSINTVYSWLRKGGQGQEPFEAFAQAVARAKAQGEVDLVQTTLNGDPKGVSFGKARSAAHILAVTRPERFGTRINLVLRKEHAEFTFFLEGKLKELLGDDQGGTVFDAVIDGWLARHEAGSDDGDEGGGEPETQDEPQGSPTIQ
ncbi:MAG TPA: hypothetical protein VG734_26010 [Lacunisphaera sp.]|nr:hypothetical protein [Lacunisphaera sp.]